MKEHAELEIRHEALTSIHKKQTDNYEQLARNMQLATNLRQKAEDNFEKLRKEF